MAGVTRVSVREDSDVVVARSEGRRVAQEAGLYGSELTLVATAISEIARNIVRYAGVGEVLLVSARQGRRQGIEIVARDNGPGIPDIEQAMQDGFTTGRSLGLGLPGARRLMDEFEVTSDVGKGTTVIMRKWRR